MEPLLEFKSMRSATIRLPAFWEIFPSGPEVVISTKPVTPVVLTPLAFTGTELALLLVTTEPRLPKTTLPLAKYAPLTVTSILFWAMAF